MFTYKWNLKDLENVPKNGYKVFSCFAGGGGSSQGYKMAGYDVIGCNEIDPRQMEIYTHNLKPRYSYLEDIRAFRMRDDLAFETIELVNKIKPKICVFENVKGLLQDKNKWYVEQIYSQFNKIGYRICHHLINCADLGVPQKRQRVFFFAVINDIYVPTIDIFGCEPLLNLDIKEKHITIGEIESDYKGNIPNNTIIETMKNYKKGDKDLGAIHERVDRIRKNFSVKIVIDDYICGTLRASANDTIRADYGNINFSEKELKQIGSWSQDYNFKSQKVHYVLGMSVPPLAMYRISKEIQTQWLDKLKA